MKEDSLQKEVQIVQLQSGRFHIPVFIAFANNLENSITADAMVLRILKEHFPHRRNATLKKMDSGKPFLEDEHGTLCCSISHTKDAVCVAVSEQEMGIDVERADRAVHPALIERIRHKDEQHALDLIHQWCAKEATLKLLGTGLRKAMNSLCLHSTSDGLHIQVNGKAVILHHIEQKKHVLYLATFEDGIGKE